jgi:ankyrin repeat protein
MHTLGPMLSRPGPKIVDKLDAVELVKVLMKHGANADVRLKRPILGRHHDSGDAQMGEGTTPLVRAFKNFDLPVIRALIEGGADATLTQRDYSTTVMTALSGGGARGAAPPSEATVLDLVTLFLDHGVDVDAFNQEGQTALHLAAGRGFNRVVQLLADRGATLDLKNRQGRTPLDIAAGTGAAAGPGGGPRGPGRGAPIGPRGGPGVGAGGGTPNPATATLLRQLIAARAAKP